MKKFFALALFMMLTAAALTACTGKTTTTTQATEAPAATVQLTEAPTQSPELTQSPEELAAENDTLTENAEGAAVPN